MLSLFPVKNAAQASHYYEKDDYYAKDSPEAREASVWLGRGSERLGLQGPVDKEAFRSLLEGRLPDGTTLGRVREGGTRQHHPGWDLTFSAPKSVSILAEVGGDQRLVRAHDAAVQEVLKYIEENALRTRVRVDGTVRPVRTDNLVVGAFRHDTSRELDPQTHTHAVLLNVTQRGDGRWAAVHSKPIFKQKMMLGALYRAELSRQVQALGYSIVRTDTDGRFEIAGVPETVLKAFSQRRAVIEKALVRLGRGDAITAAKASVMTRRAKRDVARNQLEDQWKGRLAELDRGAREGVDRARQPIEEKDAAGVERDAEQGGTRTDIDQERLAEVWSRLSVDEGFRPVDFVQAHASREATQALDGRESAREAVAYVAAKLAERDAVFTQGELMRGALAEAFGEVSVRDLRGAIRSLAQEGTLVRADHEGERAWTTAEAITLEAANVRLFREGKGAVDPLMEKQAAGERLNSAEIRAASGGRSLNKGQFLAARTILTSRDRVVGIQGLAGTGKTTLLSALRAVAEEQGVVLRGVAPSSAAANVLQREADIDSKNLAKHLLDERLSGAESGRGTKDSAGVAGRLLERFEAWLGTEPPTSTGSAFVAREGAPEDNAREVWVVDEASMVSTRDMNTLLKLAFERDIRVVVVGDSKQLPAIEAGKPMVQFEKDGGFVEMHEIFRQETAHMKEAVASVYQGDIGGTFGALGQGVHEIEDHAERVARVAKAYLALSPQERANSLVVIPSHADRVQVNARIRDGLQKEGVLTGKGLESHVWFRKGLTKVELGRASSYGAGEFVRFERGARRHDIAKGEYLRVVGHDRARGVVALEKASGERVQWYPDRVAGRSGKVSVYQTDPRTLAAGDRVRWTRNQEDVGIRNAEFADVVRVDGSQVTFRLAEDRSVRLDVNDPRNRHWDHGYAVTGHAAQGETKNTVFVSLESWRKNLVHEKMLLVGITRARNNAQVFVNDRQAVIKAIAERTGDKTSALEGIEERRKRKETEKQLNDNNKDRLLPDVRARRDTAKSASIKPDQEKHLEKKMQEHRRDLER